MTLDDLMHAFGGNIDVCDARVDSMESVPLEGEWNVRMQLDIMNPVKPGSSWVDTWFVKIGKANVRAMWHPWHFDLSRRPMFAIDKFIVLPGWLAHTEVPCPVDTERNELIRAEVEVGDEIKVLYIGTPLYEGDFVSLLRTRV
jgi:hypothetical protein